MNKKKLLVMLSAVALIATVGVGATLAYFTDSTQDLKNIIETGNVNITISENAVELDTETMEYIQTDEVVYVDSDGLVFSNILPGQTVPKNPTISLEEGSRDAYIRATVTVESDDDAFAEYLGAFQDELLTSIVGTADNWRRGEGNKLYYQSKLTMGEEAVLFEEITIPTYWNNSVKNSSFTIKIQAEAVQADYLDVKTNKNGVPTINSWNALNIESFDVPQP